MNVEYKWINYLDGKAGDDLITLYNDTLNSGTFLGYSEAICADKAKELIQKLNKDLENNDIFLFSGFKNKELVVTAILKPSKMPNCSHVAEISKGVVRSDYQGTGLLQKAFIEIAVKARDSGFDLLTLDVRKDSKPHVLWEKLGFLRFGELEDYARVNGESFYGVYLYQKTDRLIEQLERKKRRERGSNEKNKGSTLMPIRDFKVKLRDELESRITLTHPLVKEVLNGEQNWELLRFMALQGYQLTKNFLEYIETLYFYCPKGVHKKRLLYNMFEEETGRFSRTANHVDLMQRFISAIGVTDKERDAIEPLPCTKELIDYRMKLVRNKNTFHMGAAAVMIASEGQNLETAAGESRHDMLPRLYNLKEEDLLFFSVHQKEDIGHVKEGIGLVADICTSSKMQQEALEAVRNTCDLFYGMYDGIAEVINKKNRF